MDQEIQSFLLWCAVFSSYAFLRLERSLLRWRRNGEPLSCYKQFGTNTIIVLMFVELQRVHILSNC